ncbi:P-loop containing nucleoside triphosphate hydrolase protein [Apiosordaria backusii]|uniref:ATP-dependent RNA helicase n=1 Tax=Apiosordaria backusii TaxID=314023 RepID=A0AA40K1F5_9PEZI|nr:P-loop containing nucleoside triphosphate hydrolase protein [Apiosordaria backusii]
MAFDKKRKHSGEQSQAKRSQSKAGTKRQKTEKRVVAVDDLPWKTVEIPEMFDDAEGFYGLEEIEGVDVVREGDVVKFVAAVPKNKAEKDGGDDGEEFEGFDDTPEESSPVDTKAKDQKKEPKAKKKDAKESKKQPKDGKKDAMDQKKPAPQPEEDPELVSNLFTSIDTLPDVEPEEEVDVSEWAPLELSPDMLSAIGNLRFSKPTPIQARAIPEIINGRDVIGKASTGSGKTLAFGIPIVESWLAKQTEGKKDEKRQPTAMILSPTRELAHQISDHLKKLCDGLVSSPYICSVTGGLAIQKQLRQLEKADIIIGTPGRLWEVISTEPKIMNSIRGIDFLVVDEADRLLKDGQFKEAEDILKALDRTAPGEEAEEDSDSDEEPTPKHNRQTLVFSATFNKALQQKLAGKARFNLMGEAESLEHLLKKLNFREAKPKFIDTNPVSQMADRLKEGLIHCGDLEKDLYLYAVLLLQPTRRALVFTNAINTVRRLTPFLQNLNLPAISLHSDMEQKARLRSLEKFKADPPKNPAPGSSSNQAPILVATDVAARGLDIPNVDLVIHYHVPRSADDYVHRSGRTARATQSGVSIMLCGPKEDIPTQRLIAKVHASAAAASGKSKKDLLGVQTIDIDRRLVSHLKPRVTLSKKITETTIAKEKGAKEDDWLKNAAEELGIVLDDDEFGKVGSWKGKGSGKKQKEREAREVGKQEVKQWRWELKELLSRRVNTGVSEKYLNGVDVEGLLRGVRSEFLGQVEGLGL